MTVDRNLFGPRLRAERERRGVTLKNIAESTKIKESLFGELERSDFSNWPQGIFGRAHLCAYLSAIGLPSQPVLAEYLQLFPQDSPVIQPEKSALVDEAPVHRAEQSPKAGGFVPGLVDRAWVVCFDAAAVCLMSSMVAAVSRVTLWTAIAFVGLAYSAIGSACFAHSLGRQVQLVASRRTRRAFKDGPSRKHEVEGRRASA